MTLIGQRQRTQYVIVKPNRDFRVVIIRINLQHVALSIDGFRPVTQRRRNCRRSTASSKRRLQTRNCSEEVESFDVSRVLFQTRVGEPFGFLSPCFELRDYLWVGFVFVCE